MGRESTACPRNGAKLSRANSNVELPTLSAKDFLVERIRLSIVSGVFKPGQRLNETRLASLFNVSRIPVREALLQLQEQGLAVNHPRRGMFVVQLTEDDTQRICSLRIVLESEALKLCRANLTPSVELHLSALNQQMETLTSGGEFEAAALDLEFHQAIWACAGNPYLTKALDSIVPLLFSHQALAYTQERGALHWPLGHHGALLDFVRGASDVTAEAAMVQHLRLRYVNPERFSSLRTVLRA